MTDVASVHESLVKLNQHTAARFDKTANTLIEVLDDQDLSAWCELVLKISQSGWHSWEVLNYYLAAVPVLMSLGDVNSLLHRGAFGYALLGSSTEPASRYFDGIANIKHEAAFDKLDEVEQTGNRLKAQFPPASGLLASYYQTSFELLARDGSANFSEWLALTDILIASDRTNLTKLYGVVRDLDSAPAWDSLIGLASLSVADLLAYLGCHQRFCELQLGAQHQLDIQLLLIKFAEREQTAVLWLEQLSLCLPELNTEQLDTLVWMTRAASKIDLAIALIEAIHQLPLANRNALQPWLAEGVDLYARNPAAGRAWVALESARSNEMLEKLSGTALFADYQRILQLFVESFIGRRLVVQAQETGIAFPFSDGLVLRLPENITEFETQPENFLVFKMMLLHQLGHFEFGIFAPSQSPIGADAGPSSNRPVSYADVRKSFVAFKNYWLAEHIFMVVEHGRVDWQLAHRYAGTRKVLSKLKARELSKRDAEPETDGSDAWVALSKEHASIAALLELLTRITLDQSTVAGLMTEIDLDLRLALTEVQAQNADVSTTRRCTEKIYKLMTSAHPGCDRFGFRTRLPEVVSYRGAIEPEQVMINLQLAELEDEDLEILADELDDNEEGLSIISMLADDDLDVDKLKQGELDQPGTLLTDLDEREVELDEENKSTEEKVAEGLKAALEGRVRPPHQYEFLYDEWDFVIGDYRRNWCTLHEYRVMDEDPSYVDDTLSEKSAIAASVRRQLNKLRPEMLTKVKGVDDGEELDIERTIEHIVDKRAGVVTGDRIYVEKQRKQRDVAALFLLDMSASTDDAITPEMSNAEQVFEAAAALSEKSPGIDDNDFLHDGYMGDSPYFTDAPARKIIDVEKEAAILMAEALKNLGDQYAICGFSGYGRDNVDFYVCKDFEEPYSLQAKGKLGGIKACRSTRMGPAIRHATKMLVDTGCKTKALIIISDGYPQDFDYGKDRSSRDYGIKDTTRALVEARQKDVQGFCLTVDQSGHDYLREMCPDKQYMVIQDVTQLPGELSKIYRMITG